MNSHGSNIVGVTFVGNDGVSIKAEATLRLGTVDDVVVYHVVPEGDNRTTAQQAEVNRLRTMAAQMIGKTGAAWRSLSPVVNAMTVTPVLGSARTPSNTLNRVIKEFRSREQFGLGKYGTTVDRTDLSCKQWLQHAKEEAMDSVLYLDRLIQIEEQIETKKGIELKVDDRATEELRKAFRKNPAHYAASFEDDWSDVQPYQREAMRQIAGFPPELGMPYRTAPLEPAKSRMHRKGDPIDPHEVYGNAIDIDAAMDWLRRNRCKLTLYARDHNTATNLSDLWTEAFVASTDPVVRVPSSPPSPGPRTPVADSFFHMRLSA